MNDGKRGRLVLSVTLDDCILQTFAAGGKGGQHQNTTNTGVRIIHRASGARGEARDNRSQTQNKRAAFLRMTQTGAFKVWLNRQLAGGPTPEEQVEKDMRSENLLVEVRGASGWEPLSEVGRG